MKYNINNPRPLPSQQRLQELFSYDKETGELTHRIGRGRVKAGSRAGSLNHHGYRSIKVDLMGYQEHRIIWRLVTSDDPGRLTVDHINGDRADNSWPNLRLATSTQQGMNRPRISTNTSNITGVGWYKSTGKWVVKASENRKQIHLGTFDSLLDAAAARLRWEREHTDSHYFRTAA